MSSIGAVASGAATKFAKGRSPFTGERVKAMRVIDPDSLELCEDPPMPVRASKEGKYTAIFLGAVNEGKTIKCQGEDAPKLATALKKFLKDRSIKGVVRSTTNYGDGKGRVWFIGPKERTN